MGKTVSEVFGSNFCEEFSSSEIIGMNIDLESREIMAKIAPKKLIHKKDLYSIQKELCGKLGVKSVRFIPVYNSSMFTAEYYLDLAFEANLLGVPVNGFFADSKAEFENGTLKIELAHGGAQILINSRCDAVMKKIVKEEFG
ncbi:MAG: hypothetical protein IKZ06_03875, partial [Oscillospiraceae bacterium]|nr:hypothetical protein [Oscillospiraceae bacterium]